MIVHQLNAIFPGRSIKDLYIVITSSSIQNCHVLFGEHLVKGRDQSLGKPEGEYQLGASHEELL
jgi:hypothetical protein